MLTQEHIAAIEEAAQTFESAAKYNSEQGRTVFAHSQAAMARKLRDVLVHAQQDASPAERQKLAEAALKAAETWSQKEHLHARDIGRGGPGMLAAVERAEHNARTAIKALAAVAPSDATGKADDANAGGLTDEQIMRIAGDVRQHNAGSWPGDVTFARAVLAAQSTATSAADAKDAALRKINVIRNSVIGLQALNWSEHVYPLVAALDEAGYEGMEYPEAREYFGTLLERAVKAENALAAIAAQQAAPGNDGAGYIMDPAYACPESGNGCDQFCINEHHPGRARRR